VSALGGLRLCMEYDVEHSDIASVAPSRAFTEAPEPFQAPVTRYSPGDFLRQFAAVIAICLGLALMAHVLVMFVGGY
jgi:hypothetical protein